MLNPSNPYSASKAAADLLARAYWTTHRLPVIVTRSSNNFGPYQYPEKVIPLFVTNAIEDRPLPLYGDGRNVRDWLYVLDNCAAIDLVLRKGLDGEIYNIGGAAEVQNVTLTRRILSLLGKPESLITPVADRPGHDRRYALDSGKIHALGWRPAVTFDEALAATVEWYRDARRVVEADQVGSLPAVLPGAVHREVTVMPRASLRWAAVALLALAVPAAAAPRDAAPRLEPRQVSTARRRTFAVSRRRWWASAWTCRATGRRRPRSGPSAGAAA